MTVLRCGGLGTLVGPCGIEMVKRVMRNDEFLNKLLDLCEHYDRQTLPDVPGTQQWAGLMAVATPGG